MKNIKFSSEIEMLANNIKRIRLNVGISQEELALRANIDRSFISKIERAKANPSFNTLLSIAHTLNVSVIQLIKEESL